VENKNALKHGSYTGAAYRERAKIRELIAEVVKLIKEEPTRADGSSVAPCKGFRLKSGGRRQLRLPRPRTL
jgi:hypothetical protein